MARPTDGDAEAIAREQNGLITREQARAAGMSDEAIRHRVRAGRWVAVHAGVFALLGVDLTPSVRIHAAVLATGPDAVASHTTAAALYGLPGFDLRATPIHATVPSYTTRRRAPAMLHRTLRLPEHHRQTAGGVPATSPARTVYDLCGTLNIFRSERALDHAIGRRLVTVGDLRRLLSEVAARGRAGSTVLRKHLRTRERDYVPPASELEARFLQLIRAYGLPDPARQVDLGDADGWIGRVDFAYRDALVVVECDGAQFHTSYLDRRADEARDARLRAAGWQVLRFTWGDVRFRPGVVADSVRRVLRRKAA